MVPLDQKRIDRPGRLIRHADQRRGGARDGGKAHNLGTVRLLVGPALIGGITSRRISLIFATTAAPVKPCVSDCPLSAGGRCPPPAARSGGFPRESRGFRARLGVGPLPCLSGRLKAFQGSGRLRWAVFGFTLDRDAAPNEGSTTLALPGKPLAGTDPFDDPTRRPPCAASPARGRLQPRCRYLTWCPFGAGRRFQETQPAGKCLQLETPPEPCPTSSRRTGYRPGGVPRLGKTT